MNIPLNSLVTLSIGSNIGDVKANLENAYRYIQDFLSNTTISSFYKSSPVDNLEQEWFLNAVVIGECQLSPTDLLTKIKYIETKMGRVKTSYKGPRVIDIDIIFWGNETLESEELTIPHPQWENRVFVLKPLREILNQHHTVSISEIDRLIEKLPTDQIVEKLINVSSTLQKPKNFFAKETPLV